MSNITRDKAIEIAEEVERLLATAGEKFDVDFSVDDTAFSKEGISFKISGVPIVKKAPVPESASAEDVERKARFRENAARFNGDPDWFDKLITIGGKTYMVSDVDLNTKNRTRRFIIVAFEPDGKKKFWVSADLIRNSISFNESSLEERKMRFEQYAIAHHLPQEWFLKSVIIKGTMYKVVDVNPHKKKYSIVIQSESNNKVYTTSPDVIRRSLVN